MLCCLLPVMGSAQTLPDDGPLTIDEPLQALAERLLTSKQGSIVAIEPSSGNVLCMVSNSEPADSLNRAISVSYSPGSTFKVAQALTLLSEYIINKDSKFSCHKGFWRDNIHIGCHEHRSPQDLIGAIAHSCNSYFCKAFMAMIKNRTRYKTKLEAIDTWHSYMTSMGLGAPLGIDMEGEAAGIMPDAAYLEQVHEGRWNERTIMWMGMGQGEVRATPLQLCNLAALIANGGYYYTPHIHKGTPQHPLDARFLTPHESKASAKAYETVVEGMRAAITRGTAKTLNTPEYEICGKTGTAENTGDDHSLFIGFAPMKNPSIAIAVVVENGGFGADLAAPLAGLLFEQYLNGTLSQRSEYKVQQWEDFMVIPETELDEFEEMPDEFVITPDSSEETENKDKKK